ncbi:MarR family transcriptional regulator [Rhodococcus sp. X156]|uniref:MarR family winged helix-turn-helix transcriptional regulator n=1 Tax=Rhodococcus sp. X156 TaxID=2499145 RepID=UPI000FD7A474|nr:MarR family transcriptional regulator [Rhodococcus sp. X156]
MVVATEVHLTLARLSRQLRRARRPTELAVGAISALDALVRLGPTRLGDLAAREQVAAPTMSRIVAMLETEGYVERSPDPQDGRARLFGATEQGELLITGVVSERTRALADRLDRLSPSQRDGLIEGLRALESTFSWDDPAGASR